MSAALTGGPARVPPPRPAGSIGSLLLALAPLVAGLCAAVLPPLSTLSTAPAEAVLASVRPPVAVVAVQVSLRVPSQAIGRAGGQPHVLVVHGDGRVERREVQLGAARQGWQLVTHGLLPGERVIVTGLTRVFDGMHVDARDIALAPNAPHAPWPA